MQTWTRRRFLTTGATLVVGGVTMACSDSDDEPTTAVSTPSTTTTVPVGDLPENDERELKRIFDPLFEPLDQHVTRIGLYDLSQGFVLDDNGTHMAIYVEPIDPAAEGWDTDKYVEMTVPGMAACTPFLFEKWSGLASMDLCQEPPQLDAPEEEPPVVTQVQLGRADASFIDWNDATIADFMAAALRSPQTARVRGDGDIEEHPDWIAARREAPDLV